MAIRILAALIAGAVAFYFVVLVWHGRDAPDADGYRIVPEFTLHDYEGKEIRQSDLAGKPTVIVVWASWCPFCSEQLTHLDAIKKEFGDAIATVTINRAESRSIAIQGSSFLAGEATGTIFLLDPDDAYYKAIGGFAMPEMLFIDRYGRIVLHKRGPQSWEELRRRVEDLLPE